MASNTCLKYPMCVEWTTELPYEETPRVSPKIYFMDYEWFLRLRYNDESQEYILTLHNKRRVYIRLQKVIVTTYVQYGSLCRPVLTEERQFSSENYILWRNTKRDISDEMPDILDIGRITITCIFHSKETNLKKRQIDIASNFCSTVSNDLRCLSRDFKNFLLEGNFTDVKLKFPDCTLSAHRSVLVARSCVFADKFRKKKGEKDVDLVEIHDVDAEVFQMLLHYMYSGETPELCDENARRLYEAAEKYAVHNLRRTCSDWLVRNQTEENCLVLLEFAEESEDDNFVEAVTCFVAEKLHLLNADSWSTFKHNHPALAAKVYEKHYASMPRDQP